MQFELWAKRRPVDGRGFQYEHIETFNDENQKYYMLDKLDREIFMEGMVLKTEWQQPPSCVMYVEFEKPLVLRKIR